MRLIDKDALINILHVFYSSHEQRTPLYRQILNDIENEPEIMTIQNPVTKEIEVYTEDDIYDEEEIIPNCTVQILTNTKTGATSLGWWRNEK